MPWHFLFLAILLLYPCSICNHPQHETKLQNDPRQYDPRIAFQERHDQMKNKHNIPKDYNPNHGYEPYWPGGDWVFRDPELPDGETTTKVPLVCGEECNYLYTRIGTVCGRQSNNMDYIVCGVTMPLTGTCLGGYYDHFSLGFKTFDTYCKFLDAQCRSEFDNRWLFVHEGNCTHNQDIYFKPIYTRGLPVTRLPKYLTTLQKTFDKASLPPPLRQRPEPPNIPDGFLPYPVRQYISNVIRNSIFGVKKDDDKYKNVFICLLQTAPSHVFKEIVAIIK